MRIEEELLKQTQERERLMSLNDRELLIELVAATRGMYDAMINLQARQKVHEQNIMDIEHSLEMVDYNEDISELWKGIDELKSDY